MTNSVATFYESVSIALANGDAATRHARQIMLRSAQYDVRSYATGTALLADPRTRDYSCVVLDADMKEGDGIDLLQGLRATGWQGKGILLDGITPGSDSMRDAERYGYKVLERTIADGPLIAAIAALVDRDWKGWIAQG